MAAVEDTGSLCPSLLQHLTSTKSSDWTDISAAANDHWNRECCHRWSATSFSRCRLQSYADETPEVVNLRRIIARQIRELDEQRRRIKATEQQIAEYERRIHDNRCAQDGYDYLQRAYNLVSYDHNDDDFVNRYRHRIVTEDTIAVYYRQASDELEQRLINVDAQLVDIANSCRQITSADDDKNSREVDQFGACRNEDQKVDDGSALGRRAFRLDALRLELERADEIHRQQLVERRRLSSAVEDADSQLRDEERRLAAMLSACDRSSSSSDIRKLSQPLKAQSDKLQTGECRRRTDKDLQLVRKADMDSHAAISSISSTLGITRLNRSEKNRNDEMPVASESREINSCGDIFTSDSASEDIKCGSLTDNDDLFTDWHRLVTLV